MSHSKGQCMKIGFIGAGKVGCSLGKFFAENGVALSGYCSRSEKSAQEAAAFTGSAAYPSRMQLVSESDLIFLTVPDGSIGSVCSEIIAEGGACLRGKMLFHCSGALSSQEAFAGLSAVGACGASVHPIFPVSDKFTVYRELADAYFCIEGDEPAVQEAARLLTQCGASFQRIDPADKTKYHAGCVFASNLVCALMQESFSLLGECGFTQEGAREALAPLIRSNLEHVLSDGTVRALTGPVERCDIGTVEKHLQVLGGDAADMYRVLSAALTDIAQEKHPQTDYTGLRSLLHVQ